MRAFRKKRRPGNRKMTAVEEAKMLEAKALVCIPCLVWALAGNMDFERIATVSAWDHKKSGNIRIGHKAAFANCDWHHQKLLPDGWTFADMTMVYGPSLMDGSKLFMRTYGTNDELIALQNEVLLNGIPQLS